MCSIGLKDDLHRFQSNPFSMYIDIERPEFKKTPYRDYDPSIDSSESAYNVKKADHNIRETNAAILSYSTQSPNQLSIDRAIKDLKNIENFKNALLRDDFDITDLDQKHATLLRNNFKQFEQDFQNKYSLTDEDLQKVDKGFDSYFVGIQKKPGRPLFSPMEEMSAPPSLFQNIKNWFTQSNQSIKGFNLPTFSSQALKESIQQKLQSARKAAAVSAQKTAERMAMPSQEARQLEFVGGLSESETLGAQPRFTYSIRPGSFADRMRQRRNTPTPKTLQRAQKLETPYIPTSSSKDSASKALKRADRFGGYQ